MDRGIVDVPSRYSVPETLDRLEAILKEKGLTIFGRVDHGGEAKKSASKCARPVADLWKPEGRHAAHGRHAQPRH